jgi:hypothetical protein
MSKATNTQPELFEELDYRRSNGIEVSLLWHRSNNRVTVFVVDTERDVAFELHVPGSDALLAFHHPYAYAALFGVAPAAQ